MSYHERQTHILFLTSDASDVSGYNRMDKPPLGIRAASTKTGVANSGTGEVLIYRYCGPAVGLVSWTAGDWVLSNYAQVSDAAGVTTIKAYIYSRDAAGSETLIFSGSTAEIEATTETLYTITSTEAASAAVITDRVVIKYYAVSTNATNITVTLNLQGATGQSRVLVPFAMVVEGGGDMAAALYNSTIDGIIASGGGDVATDDIWTALGDLAVGTGASTAVVLPAGTDGYYLKADSSVTATGVTWAVGSAGSGDIATDVIWTALGDLAVGTGAETAAVLSVGADGYVLTAASGEATGLTWAPGGGGVGSPALNIYLNTNFT
jgi:hypothetical protein